MSLAKLLLPEFDHEMSGTRRMLERVPDDRLAWRPHAKSSPLGELASHLVEIVGFGTPILKQTELHFSPPGAPPYAPTIHGSREALLQAFRAAREATRAALAAVTDEELMVPWSVKLAGQTLSMAPRLDMWRGFLLSHLIHHRAQLTVYFRLLDVPVPGLYGPSADDP